MAREAVIGGEGSLFVGEDKLLQFELTTPDVGGVPSTTAVDMTGWIMRFDVRRKDTSRDPAIHFEQPLSIQGTFNASRSLNTQRATATLTAAQMNLFRENQYRWSWKRMDAGGQTVLAWGNFGPQKATSP